MNLQPTTLIFSAELSTLSDTWNAIHTQRISDMLDDLGLAYKKVIGKYQGISEVSFVVPTNDSSLRESLVRIMLEKFEQETVLELSPSRQAFLIGKNGETHIGTWKEVSQDIAEGLDAYTYDFKEGKYYAVA